MFDRICEETRTRLALGERRERDDEHLAHCEDCRVEAQRIGLLVARLGDGAEVRVPTALSRLMREHLLEGAAAPSPFSRAYLVASLAAGGLLALTAALAGALAQTGAAEQGVYLAVVIALAYTTVSAAAVFPLLIMRGAPRLAREREA